MGRRTHALTSTDLAVTMRQALDASESGSVTETLHGSKRRILVSAEPLTAPRGKRPKPAETLLAVSEAVGSNLGLAEVLRTTTRELARAVGADIGSVWRLEPSERTLSHVAGYRIPKEIRAERASSLAFAQLLTVAQRRSSAPVCSSNSAADPRFHHPFLELVRHRSILIQPFRVAGQFAGVFVLVWTRARHRFTTIERRLVEAIAQQAGVAIENAELLVSMRGFNEELEQRVADRTAQLELATDQLRSSREELRALSLHLQQVREHERSRISREIHDELGQALTAVKMDLAAIGSVPAAVDTAAMNRALATVDHMLASVRRIASELRPQILDDLGLMAALEWQVDDFASRTGVACRLRSRGETIGVDAERSTALFRMFQETLTNIARHAGATRADVRLVVSRRTVQLDVRDNGCGVRGSSSSRAGLGLLGMRERASAFGGSVAIESGPRSGAPSGTRVRIRIPLAREQRAGGNGTDHAGHHRVRRPSGRASRAGADHSERSRGRPD